MRFAFKHSNRNGELSSELDKKKKKELICVICCQFDVNGSLAYSTELAVLGDYGFFEIVLQIITQKQSKSSSSWPAALESFN